MEIITLSPRGFGANTYLITTDGQNAIVVDPAQTRVEAELVKRGLRATHVLLTHCHFDHVGGVAVLQEGGAKVLCSDQEKPLIGTDAALFSLAGMPEVFYRVDETFQDGEEKLLNGLRIKMLLTPGHTQGSACYLVSDGQGKEVLFSGDTLFQGSIGRTDFPTGSMATLRQSLKKLSKLPDDLPVLSGHGDETTIGEEKKTNPFMADVL